MIEVMLKNIMVFFFIRFFFINMLVVVICGIFIGIIGVNFIIFDIVVIVYGKIFLFDIVMILFFFMVLFSFFWIFNCIF